MLAKLTSKNQLTLPKDVVKDFAGIQYFDVSVRDNVIVLEPVKIQRADDNLKAIREKMKKLGLSKKDVEDAVSWARKKSK
ncbi:MAG: AbrB/MazE/SpoVT family DNA-binding domain-containing protein [Syntrophales bacterium]|jgi:hypothetical protein|nr:AbrB/MazE/SpoVT family DNA-binding domain-containing protein [Syntrophales bacterium]MDY0045045.1 hypothetical protein [Syntrophales bacterium]